MFVGKISRLRLNPIALDNLPHGKVKEMLNWVKIHTDYEVHDDNAAFPIVYDGKDIVPDMFVTQFRDEMVEKARQAFHDFFHPMIEEFGTREVFMFSIDYLETENGLFNFEQSQTINDVRLVPKV